MLNDPHNEAPTSKRTKRIVGKTEYCGVSSERIMTPKKARRNKGEFFCIICDSSFTRRASVNYHFPSCVRKYGNPLGNSWNDHASCKDEEELEEAAANYDPRTIVSDILRVLGEHPTLPPLNAHMEGRRHDPEPLARTSVHVQERELPTEATLPTDQQSLHQNQTDREADKMRANKEAAVAQGEAGMEIGEAKRIARTKIVEETPTPTRSIRSTPRENQSENSTSSRTHRVSQPGALQGWVIHSFHTGVEYFVNYYTGILTVDDPRVVSQPRPLTRLGGLPDGWEMRFISTASNDFRVYFVDHNTRTNTWNDPRGPSAWTFQL